jgi:hypothetical protein
MTTERDELADLIGNHTVDENSWCMAYDGRESSYCKCGEKLYPVRTLYAHVADALLADGFRKPAVVTTAEELDDAIRRSFEEGEHLVLMSGTRPWIIWEDDYGLEHVTSAPYEDDPESFTLDDIPLPATVLHVGGES